MARSNGARENSETGSVTGRVALDREKLDPRGNPDAEVAKSTLAVDSHRQRSAILQLLNRSVRSERHCELFSFVNFYINDVALAVLER